VRKVKMGAEEKGWGREDKAGGRWQQWIRLQRKIATERQHPRDALKDGETEKAYKETVKAAAR